MVILYKHKLYIFTKIYYINGKLCKLEKFHTNTLRKFLGLRKSTNLSILYFEFGIPNITLLCIVRLLHFWMQLNNSSRSN